MAAVYSSVQTVARTRKHRSEFEGKGCVGWPRNWETSRTDETANEELKKVGFGTEERWETSSTELLGIEVQW
jgi:hypothetical protein